MSAAVISTYYFKKYKSNELSDTITRQQLQGHLTNKSTDYVARLMLTV